MGREEKGERGKRTGEDGELGGRVARGWHGGVMRGGDGGHDWMEEGESFVDPQRVD